MADEFSLSDAVSGGQVSNNPVGNPQQNQNWPANPWGQYPGAPGAGQPYPGAPGAGPAYPGAPGAGQTFPGFPGQQFPGAPSAGQQYPGAPGAFPTPPQPSAPVGPTPQSGGQLKVPYELPLPSGVMPRLVVEVYGAMKENPKRLVCDFKRKNDIAFHLNPRFDESKRVIVRNSMIRDTWGSEERQANKFPFEAGRPFKIQILCDTDNFKVAVNGEHILQYNYRVKEINEIKTFSVHGDITLSDVKAFMV